MVEVIAYFVVGLLALVVFELTTGRIHKKIAASVLSSQNRMMQHGSYVGIRTATAMLFVTMWVFWPAVFVGAAQSKLQERRSLRKVK